jgi:hypothetical protein
LAFGIFVTRSLQYELWVNVVSAIVSLVSTVCGVVVAKLLADAVARTGLLAGVALSTEGKKV